MDIPTNSRCLSGGDKNGKVRNDTTYRINQPMDGKEKKKESLPNTHDTKLNIGEGKTHVYKYLV